MDYVDIISAALADLETAVNKLEQNTSPATHMPRVRQFEIVSGKIIWPKPGYLRGCNQDGKTLYLTSWEGYRNKGSAQEISEACGHQPRLILRALRRIQAATAWCEARAEGRQRAAEEILRQQARAVEALEAEATMLALK